MVTAREDTLAKVKGEAIAAFFELKSIKRGEAKNRYSTLWGTKTPMGLYRSTKRFLEELEKNT